MSDERGQVRVRPLAECDIEALEVLAATIWRAHYPGIITPAQIEYMLRERYVPTVIRAELARKDVWWDLLLDGDEPKAYASCHLSERPDELKLDKLYVHPDRQRRGFGAMLVERALMRARELGLTRLVLAVNKRNLSAIAAYERLGFRREAAVVKDIGAGFVMDDYIMARAP